MGCPRAAAGVAAALGATAGTAVPMAALGVSDPRDWSTTSWISDLVPHLTYGAVTTVVFEALSQGHRRWQWPTTRR